MTKPPPYQPGWFIKACIAFVVALMLAFTVFSSIPRKDVLVCGFPDGSRFILSSRYDKILFNLNFRSVVTEKNRDDWDIKYRDGEGRWSQPPVGVRYSGDTTNAIRGACIKSSAKKNGIAMVPLAFMQNNGSWFIPSDFSSNRLSAPIDPKDPRKSVFEKEGYFSSTFNYALIMPLHDLRLVYEQPLSRSDRGYIYEMRFDGVYQAFSADNGKTWSDPIITTDALIFQMGKRWIDQCFVARPIEFNGDKIAPDFPEPCPPDP